MQKIFNDSGLEFGRYFNDGTKEWHAAAREASIGNYLLDSAAESGIMTPMMRPRGAEEAKKMETTDSIQRREAGQGFDREAGRSNNMLAAEAAGMVTIGRWAKRHGVSARAAVEIMQPTEAHHTGTGRRGKSRLTPVIDAALEPTPDQIAKMEAWDAGARPPVQGWFTAWKTEYGRYGRKFNVPVVGVYEGDPADAPKKLILLDGADFERAKTFAGKRLSAYASRFDDIKN